jgi:hypothetical protein
LSEAASSFEGQAFATGADAAPLDARQPNHDICGKGGALIAARLE